MRVMKQFDDLVSAITIYVCPDDKKEMNRYVYKAKALKVILIFILLLYIVSTILNFHIVAGVAGVFSVVGMIRYIKLRKTTSKRVKSTILVECNAERMLSVTTALIEYTSTDKAWGTHFYNIGSALYYAGRFNDVEKVIELMKRYRQSPLDHIKMTLLNCRLNYYYKNEIILQEYCDDLRKQSKQLKHHRLLSEFFEEAMQYPILLQLEHQGSYELIYEMYRLGKSSSMLAMVKRNYYMHQAAMGMGNYESAEVHRDFVLANGGDFWYKKNLQLQMINRDYEGTIIR